MVIHSRNYDQEGLIHPQRRIAEDDDSSRESDANDGESADDQDNSAEEEQSGNCGFVSS